MKPLIYLASPYSHASSVVREDRYNEALQCTQWLVENRFLVFSPIVHSHHVGQKISGKVDPKYGWGYWKEFDTEMITRCDEIWILVIPGVLESVGVKAEIKINDLQGKKCYLIWGYDYDNYKNVRLDFIESFESKIKEILNAQAYRL